MRTEADVAIGAAGEAEARGDGGAGPTNIAALAAAARCRLIEAAAGIRARRRMTDSMTMATTGVVGKGRGYQTRCRRNTVALRGRGKA